MRTILVSLFYLLFVRPWLSLVIGVRFENRKSLKNINQFIIVANHNSHFDALSIMAALPPEKFNNTRTIVAGDYFGKSKLTCAATKLFFNAILINRKRIAGGVSTIDILDEYLKKGRSLILFPEGSRGEAGVIKDFKKGIAILLKQNPSVPFVPVYLDGFGRVLPKDKKLIIPLVCKVRFGEPVFPKGESIDEILDEVKKDILKLKEKDERDRNRFPSPSDYDESPAKNTIENQEL